MKIWILMVIVFLELGAGASALALGYNPGGDIPAPRNPVSGSRGPMQHSINLRTQPLQLAGNFLPFFGPVGNVDLDFLFGHHVTLGPSFGIQKMATSLPLGKFESQSFGVSNGAAFSNGSLKRTEAGVTLGAYLSGSVYSGGTIFRVQGFFVRESLSIKQGNQEKKVYTGDGYRLTSEVAYQVMAFGGFNFEIGLGLTAVSENLQSYLLKHATGPVMPSLSFGMGWLL